MRDPYIELIRLLQEERPVALAKTVRQVGSAPRRTGAKCLVLEDGAIVGTIGGGMLEHLVREAAMAALRERTTKWVHFELKGEDVARTDMVCGGIVDVYIEPLLPNRTEVISLFEDVTRALMGGKKGVLLTKVHREPMAAGDVWRTFILQDDIPRGLPERLREKLSELHGYVPKLVELSRSEMLFWEPIMPQEVLYIFGAGHVSTFVAQVASLVGFDVVVIDDRAEFANRERFPTAKGLVVKPIEEALEELQLDSNSYVAIITRGHIHDATALRHVVQRDVAYIGMIGSKRKKALVYRALMEDGIPKEVLEKVHCPIGLPIGAETPEEIAVSIVAELIQARASSKAQGQGR